MSLRRSSILKFCCIFTVTSVACKKHGISFRMLLGVGVFAIICESGANPFILLCGTDEKKDWFLGTNWLSGVR